SPAEGVFEFAALLLEFRQFRLAGGQFGLHRGECAAGAGDLFVGPAQLASSGATLRLDLTPLAGDRLELLADRLELALGLAAALRRGTPGGNRGERDRQEQPGDAVPHQPAGLSSSSDWPVISAGTGTPSRSSSVGATSRRAPPLRSVAGRGPR